MNVAPKLSFRSLGTTLGISEYIEMQREMKILIKIDSIKIKC